MAVELFDGTEKETHNENANPAAAERLEELVSAIPFGNLFADRWGSNSSLAAIIQKRYAQISPQTYKSAGERTGTRGDSRRYSSGLTRRSGVRHGRWLDDDVSRRAGRFPPRSHSRFGQRGDCHVDTASARNQDRVVELFALRVGPFNPNRQSISRGRV